MDKRDPDPVLAEAGDSPALKVTGDQDLQPGGTTAPVAPGAKTYNRFECQLAFSPQSLARLSLATAMVVGLCLTIPDAVATLPSVSDGLSWVLKILGLWMTAVVLWFVGFLAVLHVVGLVRGRLRADGDGIKLGRWEKVLPWTAVEALVVEPLGLFSRVFNMQPPVVRMSIYCRRKPGGKLERKDVPSCFYTQSDFDQLCLVSARNVSGHEVQGPSFCLSAVSLAELKPHMRRAAWQRVVLGLLIAAALVMFLGRKAVVHFVYNMANQQFAHGQIANAQDNYKLVVQLEPAFAPGWHNLANAEFAAGKQKSAEEHWERALAFKPDFVEPKVGLAYLYMKRGELDRAKKLLDRALAVAPGDPYVQLNLAEWHMRMGHVHESMQFARYVITVQPQNLLAISLVAQGQLDCGQYQDALTLLKHHDPGNGPVQPNAAIFYQRVRAAAEYLCGFKDKAQTRLETLVAQLERAGNKSEADKARAQWQRLEAKR